MDPMSVSRWKHGEILHTEAWYGILFWRNGSARAWVQEMTMHPPKKDEVVVALEDDETACGTCDETGHRRTQPKTKGVGPNGS